LQLETEIVHRTLETVTGAVDRTIEETLTLGLGLVSGSLVAVQDIVLRDEDKIESQGLDRENKLGEVTRDVRPVPFAGARGINVAVSVCVDKHLRERHGTTANIEESVIDRPAGRALAVVVENDLGNIPEEEKK